MTAKGIISLSPCLFQLNIFTHQVKGHCFIKCILLIIFGIIHAAEFEINKNHSFSLPIRFSLNSVTWIRLLHLEVLQFHYIVSLSLCQALTLNIKKTRISKFMNSEYLKKIIISSLWNSNILSLCVNPSLSSFTSIR